jgi:protease IV
MRLARALRTLSVVSAALLLVVLFAMAVSALSTWLATAILLGVTLVAFLGWKVGQRTVRRGTVLELDLDGGVVEHPTTRPIDRLTSMGSVVLRDVVDSIQRGAADDRVTGLVVRLGNGRLGLAQAQEIRDAIIVFRAAGKRTVAFAESFGESGSATIDYYLAASFEEVHLQPLGGISIQGVLARTPFLGALFGKVGAVPDLDHRREYKAAKYMLTETDYVEPHREATESILADHLDQMVSSISSDRGLSPERVMTLIDAAPLGASEALELGLVDHLSYRDQAYEAAGVRKGRLMFANKYLKRAGGPYNSGPRVALIYGTGPIARGRTRFDPLDRGSSFGADEVAEAFREARSDKGVKAIIFRVDSPGGSAVASEIVRHEVVRAKEAGKIVVVSMGDVAGSGGYFVATHADRIVAQPGTITGSIGVVSGKVATAAAWARVGVDWRDLHLGENATFFSPDQPFTDSERARLEHELDSLYEGFKDRVAEGRGLDPAAVEELAKGRIWTGRQAKELGLVDELGGLATAVSVTKELLGLPTSRSVHLIAYPRDGSIPFPRRRESSEPILIKALSDTIDRLSGRVGDPPIQLRLPAEWR